MDYEYLLIRESEKLGRLNIPSTSKDAIKVFIRDLRNEGISSGRQYAYILRLRIMAVELGDKFTNPTAEDLKDFMARIRQKKVRWGSGEEHHPSGNAIQAYQVTLKRFYKWLLGNNETYPECVKWLKIKSPHRSNEKKPEPIISEKELSKMLDATLNVRDRALISLLYDSGCRISELLTMDRRDLGFDQYGAKITVSGKTGVRTVRIVGDSVIYLREWLKAHPDGQNPDAPLFTRVDGNVKERMEYEQVHAMLKKVLKRAGITRRIYPHLFRHTRATLLSTNLKEPLLEKTMGWVHGSRMTQTYVHLTDADLDNAILRSHGIKPPETSPELPHPKECPRCGEPNASDARYCRKCWLPLNIEEAMKQSQRLEKIESAVQVMGIDEKDKERLKAFGPEAKLELLADLLIEIEKAGQLKDLKKVIMAMGTGRTPQGE